MNKVVIANVAQTVMKQGAFVVPDEVADDPSALAAYLAANINSAEILTDPDDAQPISGFTLCNGEHASVAAYALPEERVVNRFTGRCFVYNEGKSCAAYRSEMEIARFLTDTEYELVGWVRKGVIVGYGIYKVGFRPTPLTRHRLAEEQRKGAHMDFQRFCVEYVPRDARTGNYLNEETILEDWKPGFPIKYISYFADADDKRSAIGFEMMHYEVVDLEHLHDFDASVDHIIETENSPFLCTCCGRRVHPRNVQYDYNTYSFAMQCGRCHGEVVRTDGTCKNEQHENNR